MRTAFDKTTGEWEIEWPGRISRHDLVYLSPPDDPMTGLIIGNGEIGTLCYVNETKIFLVINRSDLWDDASYGIFDCVAAEEEETHTTLRHGGRIIIDFKMPIFDLIYLSDFSGRLSIADGRLELNASGPFGSLSFSAFVCYDQDILICTIKNGLFDQSIPVNVVVERFGSRMFHRWYSQVNPDTSLGLKGTESHVRKNGGFITHALTSGSFALGCSSRCPNGYVPTFSREGENRVSCNVKGQDATEFDLISTISEPGAAHAAAADAVAARAGAAGDDIVDAATRSVLLAEDQIQSAFEAGPVALLNVHRLAWKSFWLRSLMESGDDFLDNLWHLVMYYSNSSQRGKYPGRFCGFLWNWQRDFQAWGFYFHFNQQQVYWPLNAAGHHDLLESYLDMRFEGLAHAKEDASNFFGVNGAVVSDVTERRGYNSKSQFHNHTPVAQIAMEFWKQYQFTGDGEFLKERALPYLIAAATFFSSLFEKGEDGAYHTRSGSGYEGGPLMRDVMTEIAIARVLFPAALKALEIVGENHSESTKWQAITDALPRPQIVEQPETVIEKKSDGYVLGKGLLKGSSVPSNRIFAAGWGIQQNRLMSSFSPFLDMEYAVHAHPMWLLKGLLPRLVKKGDFPSTYGLVDLDAWTSIQPDTNGYNDKIFPGVELSSVFPSGYIGLSQTGTQEYFTAVTTAKLFASDIHGWIPFATMLARLGLAEELSHMFEEVYKREPVQVNGTVVDSSGLAGEYAGPEAPLDLRSSLAKYTTGEIRHPIQTKSFRFFSIHSSLANGMNEMLLQSHDGIIRIAPAVDHSRSARFTLHAIGGFVVSAEVEMGEVLWVTIKSGRGGVCRMQNPWKQAAVFINDIYAESYADSLITCSTEIDDLMVTLPEREVFESWQTVPARYDANQGEKRCPIGKNMLGLPRTF